jgi:hypothetical protein
MSDLDVFGPLVVDTEIGAQIEATLAEWYPTYLAMLVRNVPSIGSLPAPGSYVHTSDPTHFPEEAPPTCVIAVPGTMGEPKRDAANWRAMWDVRIVVFVQAVDRNTTEQLAKYYATATRAILVQKPSLGNFAEGTSWRGTSYGIRVADRDQRTKGSCENRFAVDVRDVVQAFTGPVNPITTLPADWPSVSRVTTILTPQPLQ